MRDLRRPNDAHDREAFGQDHSHHQDFHPSKFFGGFEWSGPFWHAPGHGIGWWHPPNTPQPQIKYRSFDGSQNNLSDPQLNAAGTEFGRIGEAHFADGISIPLAGNNPRTISNLVVGAGDADVANPKACPPSCTPGVSSSITI